MAEGILIGAIIGFVGGIAATILTLRWSIARYMRQEAQGRVDDWTEGP